MMIRQSTDNIGETGEMLGYNDDPDEEIRMFSGHGKYYCT